MAGHPEWVLKHKQPGTEIRGLGGKYYLYKITSVWNKEKKRADKKTVAFLGTITQDGFISKEKSYQKHPSLEEKWQSKIATKEFGASNALLSHIAGDISVKLQELFPSIWQEILVMSLLRFIHQCPMKNIEHLYYDSYFSNKYPDLKLTGTKISFLLQYIGAHRTEMVDFMKSFINGGEFIIFDVTSIASSSEKLTINQPGYNSKHDFNPQINLLYIFSVDQQEPVYYRIVPGNVRDISAFKLGVVEAGLKKVVIIADKGFSSNSNIELLQNEKLGYIIPLKRNNKLIQYDLIKGGNYKLFNGYFMFKRRCIWYYSYQQDNQQLFTFIDDNLKQEEIRDYLTRVEEEYEGYTQEGFFNKQHTFGTITVTVTPEYCNYNIVVVDNLLALKAFTKNNKLTNDIQNHTIIFVKNKKQLHIYYLDESNSLAAAVINIDSTLCAALGKEFIDLSIAKNMIQSIITEYNIPIALWNGEKVYQYLKNRMQIENSFDAYKNVLHADKTYMQSQKSLEAWMFLNHIAMMCYYKIYQLLLNRGMLNKHTPLDIMALLTQVRTLKINNSWITSEIPGKITKIINKLGMPITY